MFAPGSEMDILTDTSASEVSVIAAVSTESAVDAPVFSGIMGSTILGLGRGRDMRPVPGEDAEALGPYDGLWAGLLLKFDISNDL